MDTPCPDLGGPEMADRYKRLATPASAVGMVGGVVTAFLMPQTPDTTASGQTVIAFFHAHHTAMYVAAFSVAYAAVAAVLFFVSVAYYLRARGSQILAATTAVGGAVFASGALLGAGLLVAANDAPGRMTADVAKTLNILQDDAFFLAVIAGLGISFLSIGVASLRTKALPKWLAIVTTIAVGDRTVKITNPDRVYFPARGETKLDLANYYIAVADGIVRALYERPCMLHRYPEGVGGEKIYQKRLPKGAADWVQTVQVSFPSGRTADELCVTEIGAVVWAVQMSTVEFHPWHTRRFAVEQPDELRT